MTFARITTAGVVSGLIMGIALFVTGAVAAYFFYGPQMAPEGKFEEEQMNPWHFIWTKLVIGIFFGIVFTAIYAKLPMSQQGGLGRGLLYGFLLWLVISMWNLSHPLIYGPLHVQNQLFWLVYTLGGFLGYGAAVGFFFNKRGVVE